MIARSIKMQRAGNDAVICTEIIYPGGNACCRNGCFRIRRWCDYSLRNSLLDLRRELFSRWTRWVFLCHHLLKRQIITIATWKLGVLGTFADFTAVEDLEAGRVLVLVSRLGMAFFSSYTNTDITYENNNNRRIYVQQPSLLQERAHRGRISCPGSTV